MKSFLKNPDSAVIESSKAVAYLRKCPEQRLRRNRARITKREIKRFCRKGSLLKMSHYSRIADSPV